ncbi:MAG: stage II sporulation protein D [Clostridia bacterium]|nr:stage II sporulation protein D [Clostridia bacterium]
MKKIIMYVLILVLITFMIPFFFTRVSVESSTFANKDYDKKEETISENLKNDFESIYDYKDFSTIKLLHSKTNTIEELPLDEYLYGVVSAEMPVDFDLEALKAQAIVARTYTIYKIMNNNSKHGEANICDDSACCQAWITKEDRLSKWDEDKRKSNWEKILLAVNETKGKIITYEGKPINAFFHSNSGGLTEMPVDVWGGSDYPYLQTVETSGEDVYAQYSSELELTKKDFISKLKEKYADFSINFNESDSIKVLENTPGGRIKTIKIGNHNLSGVEVRTIFGLKSANFSVEIGEKIKFKVIGYGHGVGMSQTGADSLAKQGYKCEDIIKHFYTGVEIVSY